MSHDRYQGLTNSPVLGPVAKRLGLPAPPMLERHEPGKPVVRGPVLLGEAYGGRLRGPAESVLRRLEAHVQTAVPGDGAGTFAALIYDASAIDDSARLHSLYEFFQPVIRNLAPSGRVLVLGTPPEEAHTPREATAQRALEGFVRSVAKEIGRNGSTAQLVEISRGAEEAMESTLRFLLSARSAFVDGQAIRIEPRDAEDVVVPADWERPLEGRAAAVTGAARGIGEAIAAKLAELGADVLCIDLPTAGDQLSRVANRIGGSSLALDITDAGAPDRLAGHIEGRSGRVDAFVHNAGITRDKTLGRMPAETWDMVLDVNLSSQERVNDALLDRGLLGGGSRLISVSSVSGIAGNRGQTNYATSKAGVIGMVRALAEVMRERDATANAVAPGFIETAMTAAMPIATREAGRRTSSLVQGGQPVDVAETVGWLASPASSGVNGNVVRVCGQALIGA